MIAVHSEARAVVGVVAIALIVLGGCSSGSRTPTRLPKTAPSSVSSAMPDPAQLRARRDSEERSVQSLPVGRLIGDVRRDSRRGVEPFNSRAYRELIRRGPAIAEAIAQSGSLDSLSVLEVLALREIRSPRYASISPALRARILVSALENSRSFNTWGIPHAYSEAAADAIVELGRSARPYLLKLLEDNQPAYVWGSEEATESARYHYRVKDYAWWLLMRIDNRGLPVPMDPARRDSLIASYPR